MPTSYRKHLGNINVLLVATIYTLWVPTGSVISSLQLIPPTSTPVVGSSKDYSKSLKMFACRVLHPGSGSNDARKRRLIAAALCY